MSQAGGYILHSRNYNTLLSNNECLKDSKCREMYHSQKGSAKVPQPEIEFNLESINSKSKGKRKSKGN